MILDVLGPIVEILTPLDAPDDAPCAIRGTIPPGVSVPLHSHPEPETFVAQSGTVEGLARSGARLDWVHVAPGDVLHVPGDTPHAWRNQGAEPAVTIIVTANRIARFFHEVGTPVAEVPAPGPPTPAAIERFLAVAERYGYWNATPEENAAIGIRLA
jgi:quercetin dioxygenase-like cupin family protein